MTLEDDMKQLEKAMERTLVLEPLPLDRSCQDCGYRMYMIGADIVCSNMDCWNIEKIEDYEEKHSQG